MLINPKMIHMEGKQVAEEGCLSIPGFREQVRRAKKATVRAQDVKGKHFEMTGEDLLARAFQHEIEHLMGKLVHQPHQRAEARSDQAQNQRAGESRRVGVAAATNATRFSRHA